MGTQPSVQVLALIEASVVADDIDWAFGVPSFKLLEQGDRRVGIDLLAVNIFEV